MKTLIILRHGKAELYRFDLDDFDRKLADRGRKNATDMGKFIAEMSGKPDLILSSDAKRTQETAQLAAEGLNYPISEILYDNELYLTPSYIISKVLSNIEENVNSCLLVGHNPGLTDLINDLGVRLDNLPTGSAVCFSFKCKTWDKISAKKARFEWIKLAREL